MRSEHNPRDVVAALLRNGSDRCAYVCTFLAAIIIFAISGVSLDAMGYHYDSEGGSALLKVHPGTLLMLVALGFRALAQPTLPGLARLFLDDSGLVLATGGIVLTIVYMATMLDVPVTPPVDSYLMPIFACFLLKGRSRRGLRLIAIVLVVFFVCNDLTAFYEAATNTHLFFVIPPDVTGHPEAIGRKTFDWKGHLAWDTRSTGMMGHPLDNALMTGTFIMILQSRSATWLPGWLRAGLVGLSLPAMAAFGGRVAMIVVIILSCILWTVRSLRYVAEQRRLPLRGLAVACAVAPVAIIGLSTMFNLGFVDRFIERFAADEGSAETRLVMWRLFEPIQLSDLIFGPDQDVVKMWQRLQGLELGIESFWAGMPLGYGLAVTAVVMTSWLAMFAFLAKSTARAAWLPILYFMIVASTSAGLASKSVALGNLVVLVLTFLGGRRAAGARQRGVSPLPFVRSPNRPARVTASDVATEANTRDRRAIRRVLILIGSGLDRRPLRPEALLGAA